MLAQYCDYDDNYTDDHDNDDDKDEYKDDDYDAECGKTVTSHGVYMFK